MSLGRAVSSFIVADRKTDYLLPPSLDDWLTEDHLAWFIVEVIDQLDLSRVTRQYAGRGSKAHHPATLLAILVHGYANGVFSSRKLERATCDSVAFRYLAAGSHPDHDTLATFRRRFLDELSDLFVQVLELAREMKLFKLGNVCLDETKIHTNASRHSALSHGHIEKLEGRLKAKVQELLALAEQAGQADGPDGGFEQAYNAQAAVDAATMPVVATGVTQAPNDQEQVAPMLATLTAQAEVLGVAECLIADTGFCSEKNLQACVAANIEPLLAVARDEHHPDWRERHSESDPLPADATPMQAMAHRLKTKAGRALYALRKQTVDPVFGIIKSVMEFRQFSLRGLKQVTGEWALVCLAWNLKRMAVLRPQ